MSEYQYYDFLAVDRLLGEADRRALRALSTRARITAARFTNHYAWGDFKGDPAKLVRTWFDLHLYAANWGTRRLMIRLPRQRVDARRLEALVGPVEDATLTISGDHLILDIVREAEDDAFEGWTEADDEGGDDTLGTLVPLRADVLAGDLRLFYLLWLMAVEAGDLPADAPEPLPGLGRLTGPLAALADFLRLDPDLVAAAAERTGSGAGPTKPPADLRTAGALRLRAQALRLARERAAAECAAADRKRKADAAAAARRARIDAIRHRGEGAWYDVAREIERRNATGYDRAATLLADLRVVAEEGGTLPAFTRRLDEIRTRHARKERFIERLRGLGP